MSDTIKGIGFKGWFIPESNNYKNVAWNVLTATSKENLYRDFDWWVRELHLGKPQTMDGKPTVIKEKWTMLAYEDSEFEFQKSKVYERRILLVEIGTRIYDKDKKEWAIVNDWGWVNYEKGWMNWV